MSGETSASDAPLLVERDGALLRLVLNRPAALNALDLAMARALAQALAAAEADAQVRAVTISGAGRAFCSGGDLGYLRGDPVPAARALIDAFHEAITRIDRLRVPVLAVLHGRVAGGGMSLALACDLAIAADDTRFNLAYVNIGASCDGSSSWSLPRLVGLRKALEIALLGDNLEAPEAARLGLVNRIVPPAALASEAATLARGLAQAPTLALGEMKRLFRTSLGAPLPAQLAAEQDAFLRCAGSADFRAGVAAFAARQAPHFEGR